MAIYDPNKPFSALNRPPAPTVVPLRQLIPILREMLNYCALESLQGGTFGYDGSIDEVIYHFRPDDMALSMFDSLHGIEDIWVFQACSGGES